MKATQTGTHITKPGKHAPKTLDAMINKIKSDVQTFASQAAEVSASSRKLAPLVAAAYARFTEENQGARKLDFMKLFATPEQLEAWPGTDQEAKAPGSITQALFNGVEYLLRRANQLARIEKAETAREQALAQVEKDAREIAKERGLKGEEVTNLIEQAKTEALKEMASSNRLTAEDISDVIVDGWFAELDEFEVFESFVARILGLKYSERTTNNILVKAQEKILQMQEQETEKEAPPAPAPAQPVHTEHRTEHRPTIPFRRHAAA